MADFTVHINVTQLPQREDENGSFNVNDNLNARSIVRVQVNQFIQNARRLFSSRALCSCHSFVILKHCVSAGQFIQNVCCRLHKHSWVRKKLDVKVVMNEHRFQQEVCRFIELDDVVLV